MSKLEQLRRLQELFLPKPAKQTLKLLEGKPKPYRDDPDSGISYNPYLIINDNHEVEIHTIDDWYFHDGMDADWSPNKRTECTIYIQASDFYNAISHIAPGISVGLGGSFREVFSYYESLRDWQGNETSHDQHTLQQIAIYLSEDAKSATLTLTYPTYQTIVDKRSQLSYPNR